MANSTQLPAQDIRQVVQDVFEFEIISNAVQKMPLIGWLLGRMGTKTPRGIRVPDDGIMSLARLTNAQRKDIQGHTWDPLVYTGLPTDDTKVMSWYDTTPTDNNTDGTTGGLSRLQRAHCRRTDMATPVKVYLRDLRQLKHQYQVAKLAGNTAAADQIANDVTDQCKQVTVEKVILQLQKINAMMWATSSDYPTSGDALLWDKQHSFHSVSATTGMYLGVDRDLAGNTWYQGNRVTANVGADLEGLFNYTQYTGLALNNYGIRPKLWVAGNVLFPVFKAQAKARDLKIYSGDEIPNVPVFGQHQEAIQMNADTWIINDPSCPAKGINGATKNALLMLDPYEIVLSFFAGAQFTVEDFFDLSKIPGQAEALTSKIRTELGFWMPNPKTLVWYEDVG